jgi:hypothetical protein
MVAPEVATAALFRKALRELGMERAATKGVPFEATMKTHTEKGNENVRFVILVSGRRGFCLETRRARDV